jgi:aspartate racemase
MGQPQPGFIGILGGMGSLAGVNFAEKLVESSVIIGNVSCDQDHVPFILWSMPQIPDRSAAAFDPLAPDPFPMMMDGIHGLTNAGAKVIAVVCNTAHHWHSRMLRSSGVPILDIVDAAISALRLIPDVRRVGLLATTGMLSLSIYQSRLAAEGYTCILPTRGEMDDLVMPAIVRVKQGKVREALPLVRESLTNLAERSAQAVILGCTELPIVLDRADRSACLPTIDPTRALAEACVHWWIANSEKSPTPSVNETSSRNDIEATSVQLRPLWRKNRDIPLQRRFTPEN